MICRKKRINLRQKDLPRLRGFSVHNLENMRTFYEEWQMLGVNSAVATAELREKSEINEERRVKMKILAQPLLDASEFLR